jgi:malic enzyme
VLVDNIEEMAPIIYTPTVGRVCQEFGQLFRRPRGMYFSSMDRGHFAAMVGGAPAMESMSASGILTEKGALGAMNACLMVVGLAPGS